MLTFFPDLVNERTRFQAQGFDLDPEGPRASVFRNEGSKVIFLQSNVMSTNTNTDANTNMSK